MRHLADGLEACRIKTISKCKLHVKIAFCIFVAKVETEKARRFGFIPASLLHPFFPSDPLLVLPSAVCALPRLGPSLRGVWRGAKRGLTGGKRVDSPQSVDGRAEAVDAGARHGKDVAS